jgi:DNA-binding NtrC family response regulator
MTQERVLIVEDEENERTGLAELVSGWGYRTDTAADGVEALEKIPAFAPSIVITDVKMPRMGGMELVERLADLAQSIAVVMVTAQKATDTAFHAGRLGVQDYIEKPIDFRRLRSILTNIGEILNTRTENESLRRSLRDKGALGRLVGASPQMQGIFHLIEQVAPSTASVLITGASGTGKELVARTIHDLSPRRNKPFVPINCAAIPETLIESEIFGHEKGAFTGALERRTGRPSSCACWRITSCGASAARSKLRWMCACSPPPTKFPTMPWPMDICARISITGSMFSIFICRRCASIKRTSANW